MLRLISTKISISTADVEATKARLTDRRRLRLFHHDPRQAPRAASKAKLRRGARRSRDDGLVKGDQITSTPFAAELDNLSSDNDDPDYASSDILATTTGFGDEFDGDGQTSQEPGSKHLDWSEGHLAAGEDASEQPRTGAEPPRAALGAPPRWARTGQRSSSEPGRHVSEAQRRALARHAESSAEPEDAGDESSASLAGAEALRVDLPFRSRPSAMDGANSESVVQFPPRWISAPDLSDSSFRLDSVYLVPNTGARQASSVIEVDGDFVRADDLVPAASAAMEAAGDLISPLDSIVRQDAHDRLPLRESSPPSDPRTMSAEGHSAGERPPPFSPLHRSSVSSVGRHNAVRLPQTAHRRLGTSFTDRHLVLDYDSLVSRRSAMPGTWEHAPERANWNTLARVQRTRNSEQENMDESQRVSEDLNVWYRRVQTGGVLDTTPPREGRWERLMDR